MRKALVTVALVLGLLLATAGLARAVHEEAVVDFEDLAEGEIVSSVDCTDGVDCGSLSADPGGSIAIHGVNPDFGEETNAAIVFDADCTDAAGSDPCTGEDFDLMFPEQGNMLIIAEDLEDADDDGLVDDPDDADVAGQRFDFVFAGWGTGTVDVVSIVVADIESSEGPGTIELFANGDFTGLLATVDAPVTGDGEKATVALDVAGVASMRLTFGGSVAIDDLVIRPAHGNGGVAQMTPTDTECDEFVDGTATDLETLEVNRAGRLAPGAFMYWNRFTATGDITVVIETFSDPGPAPDPRVINAKVYVIDPATGDCEQISNRPGVSVSVSNNVVTIFVPAAFTADNELVTQVTYRSPTGTVGTVFHFTTTISGVLTFQDSLLVVDNE